MQTLIDAFNKTDLATYCEDITAALEYYNGSLDADDFIDWYAEEYVNSAEVIYYHYAIKYLAENDPSLTESMGLASEYGYTPDKLNSELLATLLLQQNLRSELEELRDELEEYFESLDA